METNEDRATKLDNDHALIALRGAGLPPLPEQHPALPRARRGSWLGSLVGLAVFGAASAAAAVAGGVVTSKRPNRGWHRLLRRSSRTRPERVLGLVRPVLHSLGALSAWRVARAPESEARTTALVLWGTQLAFNAAWTPIFFGAHRPRLAMADLLDNYASLGAYALAARKVDKTAARMVVPYLGWLTLAGRMNASITGKNRGPLAQLIARG